MKKSWINKLIELLNEYEQLNMCRKFDSFEMYTFENSNWVDSTLEDTVISARYGFIKWLVDNDKIDLERILKENWQFRLFYYDLERVKNYDRLVMYLSVEDNPIEFLISILK